jgi:hypothetical protein
MRLPPFTKEQILAWADDHHTRTGHWPTPAAGPIRGVRGETWGHVDAALHLGLRGLAGGSSLPRLLAAERGARNRKGLPRLAVPLILAWADAHRQRTERWPTRAAGPVPEEPGTTWAGVDAALHNGARGLRGGSSLARLLAKHRGGATGSACLPCGSRTS